MRGAWLLVIAGCDGLIGLHATGLADATAQPTCEPGANMLDEDGDGIANGLDDCPGIANATQDDGDSDGVGDPCDPYRILTGDSIVDTSYFETSLACWMPDVDASWTLGGGSLTSTRK